MLTLAMTLASVMLLSACAGKKLPLQEQRNTQSPAAHYDESQYLLGQGSGSSPEVAADRARAEIAKVFEVEVRAVSNSQLTVNSQQQAGNQSEAISRRFNDDVTARTRQSLQGIEIVSNQQDKASRNWYAMAVLDKRVAAQILRQQLADLAEQQRFHLKQAQSTSMGLQPLQDIYQAYEIQKQYDKQARQLRVVQPAAQVGTGHSAASLRAMQQDYLQGFALEVSASQRWLQDLVASNLSFMHGGKKGNVEVIVNLRAEPLGQRDGWLWERSAIEIQVLLNGKIAHQNEIKTKYSAPTEQALKAKQRENVTNQVESAVAGTFYLIEKQAGS